jgi:exodeoxyribonuclease VII small subunit
MNESKNFFEQKMARLQVIVKALETDELPLEESMALYKEGLDCALFCKQRLEKARHELSVWQDGEMKPFIPEDESSGSLEDAL